MQGPVRNRRRGFAHDVRRRRQQQQSTGNRSRSPQKSAREGRWCVSAAVPCRPARPRHHHRGVDHDRLASCCRCRNGHYPWNPRLAALAWEGGLRICFQSSHDRHGAGPDGHPYASLFAAAMLPCVALAGPEGKAPRNNAPTGFLRGCFAPGEGRERRNMATCCSRRRACDVSTKNWASIRPGAGFCRCTAVM